MLRTYLLLLFAAVLPAQQKITLPSTLDGAAQPIFVWFPTGVTKRVPLVVHLHSWSAHFDSSEAWQVALKEAQDRQWAFVAPEFRGPNERPEACASPEARQDILDAVDYMYRRYPIDRSRTFLLGGSGGGHMTLVMAAHTPERWRAASAWVPIADLAEWYAETKRRGLRYWKMLEGCAGGPPGGAVGLEYSARSPLPFLARARGLALDIQTGIHDGHTGSVPVSHSLLAFNALANTNGVPEAAFSPGEIATIVESQRLPSGYPAPPVEKRRTPILHRRSAGPARITLFEGGHETDFPAAFTWFDSLAATSSSSLPKIGDGWLGEFNHAAAQLLALAETTPASQYSWRPAPGVRSMSEVFMHIVETNYWIMGQAGISQLLPFPVPEAGAEKGITKKEEIVPWLRASFDAVRRSFRIADTQKNAAFLGKETPVGNLFLRILVPTHEHMGQAIAYARMNGITPPWAHQ